MNLVTELQELMNYYKSNNDYMYSSLKANTYFDLWDGNINSLENMILTLQHDVGLLRKDINAKNNNLSKKLRPFFNKLSKMEHYDLLKARAKAYEKVREWQVSKAVDFCARNDYVPNSIIEAAIKYKIHDYEIIHKIYNKIGKKGLNDFLNYQKEIDELENVNKFMQKLFYEKEINFSKELDWCYDGPCTE